MVIRPLTHADFDAVFAAFVDAFSDYVVPLTLTREQLKEMMTRRGWTPEASAGAFEDERLVAFTLNAVEGARACYPLLRDHGCTEYVLEVIDANERAAALYVSEGFVITRGLQCWRIEAVERRPLRPPEMDTAAEAAASPLWWDIQPAWQNTTASIARATDEHVTLANEDGYVIVFPNTGDVPQLAVRREARRRGVGTRLLQAAAARAEKPLRIMNVDERDRGIAAFLEHHGAERFVRQLEMVRSL